MKYIAFLLLLLPLAHALDLGGFEIEDGKLVGKYLPAGLEGKISCYSDGKHIMDIIYKNDSIEISIQFFDALQKIIKRDPFLKEEIQKALAPIKIKGASVTLEYGNCIVELHDTPTRFLKICSDKIVFSEMTYNVERIDKNIVKLRRDNFTATLISNSPIEINENIIAYDEVMLVSFSYIEGEISLEEAFKNRVIGGEFTIVGYNENSTDYISYFGNISISPLKLEKGEIVLKVKGDIKAGGKVIKINMGKKVCLSDNFLIKYDGNVVKEASNFEDILNPDDDGLNAEYYKLESKEGLFILVSIPHFSEHKLSICFLTENIHMKIISMVFGILVILLATFYILRS